MSTGAWPPDTVQVIKPTPSRGGVQPALLSQLVASPTATAPAAETHSSSISGQAVPAPAVILSLAANQGQGRLGHFAAAALRPSALSSQQERCSPPAAQQPGSSLHLTAGTPSQEQQCKTGIPGDSLLTYSGDMDGLSKQGSRLPVEAGGSGSVFLGQLPLTGSVGGSALPRGLPLELPWQRSGAVAQLGQLSRLPLCRSSPAASSSLPNIPFSSQSADTWSHHPAAALQPVAATATRVSAFRPYPTLAATSNAPSALGFTAQQAGPPQLQQLLFHQQRQHQLQPSFPQEQANSDPTTMHQRLQVLHAYAAGAHAARQVMAHQAQRAQEAEQAQQEERTRRRVWELVLQQRAWEGAHRDNQRL
ncbi:hypothetical protein N2152v2_003905 [Parachlorella kessleri]